MMTNTTDPRKLALERGETFYYPIKPCGAGHVTKRNTKSRNCYECQYKRKAAADEQRRYLERKTQESATP